VAAVRIDDGVPDNAEEPCAKRYLLAQLVGMQLLPRFYENIGHQIFADRLRQAECCIAVHRIEEVVIDLPEGNRIAFLCLPDERGELGFAEWLGLH
jgi:hypothetical protein